MFPDDATLIARGKYTTLSREKYEQIKRVQDICRLVQGHATLILNDCQKQPPENKKPLEEAMKALANASAARERIITLCLGMDELEAEAWGAKA